jgi:SAM-dependent methyltransferase
MSHASLFLPTPVRVSRSKEPVLLCWKCGDFLAEESLAELRATNLRCRQCGTVTVCKDGIWRCLSFDQTKRYERFITEYESIRAAEGRGSMDAAYYLNLPFQDISGTNSGQWKIRAATFRYVERVLLTPFAAREARPLHVLDLGAGNGWLSYRLSLLGHAPVAVDLLTNNQDGLGAADHYRSLGPKLFPRVQASLDTLPFASASFDLAIFNASFHYSEDYTRTLREAIRCVRTGGTVIIMDTPWYARQESGEQMIAEKHSHFQRRYGFASNSIPALEFVTPARLRKLEAALDIKVSTLRPFYGLQWSLRPLRAWVKRRRTPSQFRVFVVKVPA